LTKNFVEELSWLLENKKNISLKETVLLIKDLLKDDSSEQFNMFKIKSNRLNKNVLVGILPQLFQDNELFKSNADILDFADEVLNIKINSASNRSRKEYIGCIVCEVPKLDDRKLNDLGISLENILGNDSKIKKMKKAKKQPNFSWNDAIVKLSKL